MKEKITCRCDNEFEVEIPELSDIDQDNSVLKEIKNGNFLTYRCPECGLTLPLEFKTRIKWSKIPGNNNTIMLIPERDRMGFINGAVKNEKNDSVVIGFQELLERIAVIENDLSVLTIESLKLLLLEKAASSLPDKKPVIFFNSVVMDGNTKNLEFYIYGLKEKEVAKAMIPFSLYKEEDLKIKSGETPDYYDSFTVNGYISVNNISFDEDTDEE